ncbi:MAG: universal stress protein [Pseudomonadales bacterium]
MSDVLSNWMQLDFIEASSKRGHYMFEIKRILAVIDPTTETQRALTRAAEFARQFDAELTLFVCDYVRELGDSPFLSASSQKRGRQSFIHEKQKWVDKLAQPLREEGIQVDTEAVWGKRFYEEVIRKCLRANIDLVVKATEHHSKIRRTFFSGSDWHLIRECPATVLLVKLDEMSEGPELIAAVDPIAEQEIPPHFDQKIMQAGQLLRDKLGGKLNVVHWYESPYFSTDEEAIPKLVKQAHEEKLATLLADSDVAPENVYLRAGENENILTELVSTMHASMVIMGAISRNFMERLVIGSTAERILDRLPCDILVLKPEGFVSPVTL